MNKKKLILIADDEVGIHESLRIYLTREDYEVYSVFRGDDVMEAFQRMRPDLVILDIMMPGRTGTQVCADIRAISMTPIIILTAKGEEVDKLLGFALGADDYIVKPFSPREVVSRIAVIFRRMNQMQTAPDQGRLTVGNTEIDLKCYEVRVNGESVLVSDYQEMDEWKHNPYVCIAAVSLLIANLDIHRQMDAHCMTRPFEERLHVMRMKDTEELRPCFLKSRETVERLGVEPTMDKYDLIYSEAVQPGEAMVDVCKRYHLDVPTGYQGYAPSVSDVLVYQTRSGCHALYIDSLGFELVPHRH